MDQLRGNEAARFDRRDEEHLGALRHHVKKSDSACERVKRGVLAGEAEVVGEGVRLDFRSESGYGIRECNESEECSSGPGQRGQPDSEIRLNAPGGYEAEQGEGEEYGQRGEAGEQEDEGGQRGSDGAEDKAYRPRYGCPRGNQASERGGQREREECARDRRERQQIYCAVFCSRPRRAPEGSVSQATIAPSAGSGSGPESSFTPFAARVFASAWMSFTSKLMWSMARPMLGAMLSD